MPYRLSYRLADILESASFDVITSERGYSPYGKLCETHRGLRGASFTEDNEDTLYSLRLFLDMISRDMLQHDILEVPRGVKISTEEERQQLLDEFRAGAELEGGKLMVSEWLAQKRLR